MRSHFRETSKRPFLEVNQKGRQQQQELREKQRQEIEKYDRVIAETTPIATEPFTPTVKGGETVHSAFRRGNKDVIFPGFRNPKGY